MALTKEGDYVDADPFVLVFTQRNVKREEKE